jgi:hypothetical protein
MYMDGNPRTTFTADLLEAGRRLAARVNGHQWELGDLALRVEPVGSHGGIATGAEFRLRVFANEIDVAFKTLNECRHVAGKWASDSRCLDSASWSVHQALASLDDRAEVITSRKWTVAAARDYVAMQRDRPHVDRPVHGPDDLAGCRCSLCGTPAKNAPRLTRRNKR